MTGHPPSTPRPKLTLVRPQSPPCEPACDPDPPLDPQLDAQPNLDMLVGCDAARKRDPLGAACTLVWLAHTALLEVSQGAVASTEEWRTTRAIVEAAVRYLVLAQAQRIVDVSAPHVSAPNTPLLLALRQLTKLASYGSQADVRASEQVWALARRLELAVQCLFDWTVSGAIGVSKEETFALARELHFVYRELQVLAGR